MQSVSPGLQPLELGDAPVDSLCPRAGEQRPVPARGDPARRKPRELAADLLKREPDALCEDDERDPAEHRPAEAPVARAGALGGDQTALLVVAQRRGRDAAAPGHLADREHLHSESKARLGLDFKCT